METKPRILYLQKILLERTDEENPLSTTQLINILNDEYGISAHRTTVTKDIAALQEFGMDIVTIHSTQSKYFVRVLGGYYGKRASRCGVHAGQLLSDHAAQGKPE